MTSTLVSAIVVAACCVAAVMAVPFAARREAMRGANDLSSSALAAMERPPLWLLPLAVVAGETALLLSAGHRLELAVAAGLGVICAWTDVLARRIFDVVLLLLVAVALARIPREGLLAIMSAVVIAMPAIVLSIVPRFRIFGAGDLKYLVALCAALGYWSSFVAIETTIVAVLLVVLVRRARHAPPLHAGLPLAPFVTFGLAAATLASR